MTFRHRLSLLAAAALVATASQAQSPDRPWYVGAQQDFTHDSNVFRASSGETSDTLSTSSLRGGLNLLFGRQRAFADASVSHQRYLDKSARSHTGYSLASGLDWSTIERLSGNVIFNANRSLAPFNPGGLGLGIFPISLTNIATTSELRAVARLGAETKLGFEAGAGRRRVSFSAPEYASREYNQDSAHAGVSYRPSGILSLGAGVSGERTRYQAPAPGQAASDRSRRQDVFATATWVPTGASKITARMAASNTEYDLGSAGDFEGVTGFLTWEWKPSGLLKINTSLSRDTGQESGFLRLFDLSNVSATDFSQVTNTLAVRALYELTGKILVDAGLEVARRNLADGFTGATGRDTTTTLSLGAKWSATRTASLGCNVSRLSRSASGNASSDYDANRFGCFGQLLID